MNLIKPVVFLTLLIFFSTHYIFSQGFLHREGKYLFDGSGNEVILRGIGTGNWMIQEGYMMQTTGVAGTQHEFRAKLAGTIGEVKTDSFYTAWLDSHFRRIDVDSMKSWGFNCVRVAMHYKWFTPPIEDEPVPGEITWLEKGFTMIDSLLDWCSHNQMYLILDLHGAPGGQGKNADISDYDPTKPSLWESLENKNKTVALWRKLAERYSKAPWIGGYDLINETNWTFSNGNLPLWNLFKDITAAIREVDNNHLIIIEGNGYANDYSGLPSIWDDNLALSFHKYGTYNNLGSINWMINLRNGRNIPIWLGESGENSNNWYTSLIELCETNRIGWSLWPVKKPSINNVQKVTVNEDYTRLVNYWRGTTANPGVEAAFSAVLQFADNHRLENCSFQKDVVDAIMRQPFTNETIPFKLYHTGEPVFATDYNLGKNGFAYFDNDTADFHFSTNEFINWNAGWNYRNDGVDIEPCNDTDANNGFSIGWTGNNEWMEYTVVVDSTAGYTLDIRSASNSSGSKVHLEADGKVITPTINLQGTSGWYNWRTTTISDVILEKGTSKIKFVFDQGGSNLNYFKFSNPVAIDSIPFTYLNAETSEDGKQIFLSVNKPITFATGEANFSVTINNNEVAVNIMTLNEINTNTIVIGVEEALYYGGTIKLSYKGNAIFHNDQALEEFTNITVTNKLPYRFTLPTRIQAEGFYFNNGLVRESCTDIGGGYDMGYAAPGDYLDYLVYVPVSRHYNFNFRVASERSTSQVIISIGEGNSFTPIDTVSITGTGGWQTWKTVSSTAYLPAGRYTIRYYVRSGEFNSNWFEATSSPVTNVQLREKLNDLQIYPNPANDFITVDLAGLFNQISEIAIYNVLGQKVKEFKNVEPLKDRLNISGLQNGIYNVSVRTDNKKLLTTKLIIH